MRFLNWIFSTLIAIAAVVFAVSNMQSVEIFYSPLHPSLSLPLSVIALSALGIGFLSGGIFIWLSYGPLSKRADKKRVQVHGLQQEVRDLKKENENQKEQASIHTPLLISK